MSLLVQLRSFQEINLWGRKGIIFDGLKVLSNDGELIKVYLWNTGFGVNRCLIYGGEGDMNIRFLCMSCLLDQLCKVLRVLYELIMDF